MSRLRAARACVAGFAGGYIATGLGFVLVGASHVSPTLQLAIAVPVGLLFADGSLRRWRRRQPQPGESSRDVVDAASRRDRAP